MNEKLKVIQELVTNAKGKGKEPALAATAAVPAEQSDTAVLQVIHEQKLLYKGRNCNYYVVGRIPQDFSTLTVTIVVTEDSSDKRERFKPDLYEREECTYCADEIAKAFLIEQTEALADFVKLTNLLEEYRDVQVEVEQLKHKITKQPKTVVAQTEKEAVKFLSQQKLMEHTDKLLKRAGIYQSQRLVLYLIASSYKSDTSLHTGISGTMDAAKNLIGSISLCLPEEDILLLNQVSSKSFYHCTNGELNGKSLFLPHGVDKKVMQALKLLQQGEALSTATSAKDRLGNIVSAFMRVESHFSTLMYIGLAEAPIIKMEADNDNRQAIIYYNNKAAGLVNEQQESEARELLQNMVRCIKPLHVVNPNAGIINIPVEEEIKAQVNMFYQSLVKQVCLFHQFQRKRDNRDRLIATKEDMRIATELLFSSILLDSDELDVTTRRFYGQVKAYMERQTKSSEEASGFFTMQELRKELGYSGSSAFRSISKLHKLGYVVRDGHANKGYTYRISCWEEESKARQQIKDNIIAQLELSGIPNGSGTPQATSEEG